MSDSRAKAATRSSLRRTRGRVGRIGLYTALASLPLAAWVTACSSDASHPGATGASPHTATPGPAAAPAAYVAIQAAPHVLARPEFDRGPLETDRRISNLSMVFRLSPEQYADREALKTALQDPGSPSYHKFLTPQQYAARFGAKPADIARAKAWLVSQGLEVHEDSPLGARVSFSGTVGAIQTAFRAEMRKYDVAGEHHYAMATPAMVPADLAGLVLDVTNTHDFHAAPMSRRAPDPEYTSGTTKGFAPPDWANVYDVAPLYSPGIGGQAIDGTGVTIAVVGVAQVAQSDVDAWRSKFGLPASTVTMTLVPNTGVSTEGSQGSGFEAFLDVEWSGGIAKGATINYVYVGGSDTNVDDATYYAIENNLAPVLSESWGGCDGYYVAPPPNGAGYGPSDQNIVAVYGSAANVLGITYLAASGDSAATSCINGGFGGLYVNLPAAYPGVTAVGGTEWLTAGGPFTTGGSGYFTAYSAAEQVWNEAHTGTGANPSVAGGGGGISSLFSRPDYQLNTPTCTMVGTLPLPSTTAANQRMVPDVAFTSAGVTSYVYPLFAECTVDANSGDCSGTGGAPGLHAGGGTSFATPAFAGATALMVQAGGGAPLGNINPMLYTMSTGVPTAFHDITTGNNEVTCAAATDPGCGAGNLYGYPATHGYDCATGLGSVDVFNLVSAVASMEATTTVLGAVPTTTSEGTPVALTATVTVPTLKTSPQAVGGNVAFAFQSYDASDAGDLSWTIGTSAVTGGTTTSGTATLSTAIPPGLVKPNTSVSVVAMYQGDATHLPSVSPKVTITFGTLAFAITPLAPSTTVGGSIPFDTTGGVSPVKWYTGADTTCNATSTTCSSIVETTGAFTGGSIPGTVQIFAIDADGAEQTTTVQVGAGDGGTSGADGGSSGGNDGGTVVGGEDAGTTSGSDSGVAANEDSGASSGFDSGTASSEDSGTASGDGGTGGGSSSSGCSCETAGASRDGMNGGAASAALAGMLLLGLRRRRARA